MYELKLYRTEQGEKTVMVGPPGRKKMPVLIIGAGKGGNLTVVNLPLTEQRYMRDVRDNKKRRGLSGVVRQYRAIGRRLGITKAAKKFLTEAQKAA